MQPLHIGVVAVECGIAATTQHTYFAIGPMGAQGLEQARCHNGVANFVVMRQDQNARAHRAFIG
jgi:hypothetical protein